ncbi:hypothetical protein BH23CHL7_BH23CHL7_09690 [soil metagenome]
MRLRPNPPRMITVVAAVALTVVGLALSFLPLGEVVSLVRDVGLPNDVENLVVQLIQDDLAAYAALALSPLLLIAGSYLKGL